MPANVGKVSYENQVIGNKPSDNKDPKNKQKVSGGATAEGMIKGSAGNTKLSPQNDGVSTNASVDQNGDPAVQKQAGRQKKIIRQDTSYTDGAIALAKRKIGMK